MQGATLHLEDDRRRGSSARRQRTAGLDLLAGWSGGSYTSNVCEEPLLAAASFEQPVPRRSPDGRGMVRFCHLAVCDCRLSCCLFMAGGHPALFAYGTRPFVAPFESRDADSIVEGARAKRGPARAAATATDYVGAERSAEIVVRHLLGSHNCLFFYSFFLFSLFCTC